jgi:hypothetical protein
MRQRFRILLVLVVAAALVLGACSGSLLGKPKSTPTPPTPKPSPVGTIVVGGNPTCIPGDECWPTPTPTVVTSRRSRSCCRRSFCPRQPPSLLRSGRSSWAAIPRASPVTSAGRRRARPPSSSRLPPRSSRADDAYDRLRPQRRRPRQRRRATPSHAYTDSDRNAASNADADPHPHTDAHRDPDAGSHPYAAGCLRHGRRQGDAADRAAECLYGRRRGVERGEWPVSSWHPGGR